MQSLDLIAAFGEIARAKDIDRDTLQLVIEDVFRVMIRKRYGSDESFEIIFNPSQGDIQIIHIREVVADWDLEDPVTQITLTDAREIDEDFEIEDEVANEVDVADFGRRAVDLARQTFRQSVRDIEKEHIYEEYSKIVGEIVVGEVYQERRYEVLVMHSGVELLLPRREQIPRERHRKGNTIRGIVKEVRRDAGSDPQVIISRSDPVFMERLFELEVPEIYEGIVEIKKAARIPGDRAKVAVTSHDQRVDPVGACVGVKGVRIHGVVRELNNENIDVLLWSDDAHQLIRNALSPAHPTGVRLNLEADPPRARVEVPADEVSQAIGRGGVNIRLASKLTGFELDVYRNIPAGEEDIDIEEFGDELSEETIERLKTIGCDTGKAVLELSTSELARRAELDEETAGRVLEIIRIEFERGPAETGPIFEQPFTLEAMGASEEASGEEASGEEASGEEAQPAGASDGEEDLAEEELAKDNLAEGELTEEMVDEDISDEDISDEGIPEEELPEMGETVVEEPAAATDTTAREEAAGNEAGAVQWMPEAQTPPEAAEQDALHETSAPGAPAPEAAPSEADAAETPAGTAERIEPGEAMDVEAPSVSPEETYAATDEYTEDEEK